MLERIGDVVRLKQTSLALTTNWLENFPWKRKFVDNFNNWKQKTVFTGFLQKGLKILFAKHCFVFEQTCFSIFKFVEACLFQPEWRWGLSLSEVESISAIVVTNKTKVKVDLFQSDRKWKLKYINQNEGGAFDHLCLLSSSFGVMESVRVTFDNQNENQSVPISSQN